MHAQIEYYEAQIARLQLRKASLESLLPKLEQLGLEWNICNENLDFDNQDHANVIQVIQCFGGKWTKVPGTLEGTINYVRDEPVGEFTLRCWSAQPPPGCRIIEEQVEVPAEYVAAHTKTIRKVVCKEVAHAED